MAGEWVTDESCQQRSGDILAAIRKLERRLFQDNGTLSVQTRLDRHEQSLKLLTRLVYSAVGLTLTAVLTAVLGIVIMG